MKTLPAFSKTVSLLALALVASLAFGQQDAEPLTVNFTVSGEVDDQQIYVLRYAVPGGEGQGPQPQEQIQLCGAFSFPGATRTISDEPCEPGRTYSAELQLEPGTPVAIQISGMHPAQPDHGFHIVMQTFEGEMPSSPEDFTTYAPGTTHWVWVSNASAD